MCTIWVTESSEFYSQYEHELISTEYADAKVEELDPAEVIRRLCKETPDAIILDNRLPGIEGGDFIEQIAECSPNTKIIVVSSDKRGLKDIESKALTILEKPLRVSQFLSIVGSVYYGG